jgi:spermidine synthase
MYAILSIFMVGFTAMAFQICLMREFMVVFYGSEISIAFVLGNWILWGAVGSWGFGRYAGENGSKRMLLAACQLVLGLLLVVCILSVRSIKSWIGLDPGEIVGVAPMAISSFLILAPVCALLGFMFVLGCRLLQQDGGEVSLGVGRAYAWESIGSLAGGAAASFVLVRVFNSVTISVAVGLLNILVSAFLQWKINKLRGGLTLSVLLLASAIWIRGGWDYLDRYSRTRQWRGYEVLACADSIYGNVVITKRASQYSFFDNGLRLYSIPDRQASEESVHFALLENRAPRKILFIGGGAGGLIGEALKYPVDKIDYLELDPLIIRMAAEYLPAHDYAPLKDARVGIYNVDGRFFVKNTGEKYDCVITHLGDPYTAQVNRYYTVEFFREVKNILEKGGVFSFSLSSSESYISPEQGEYLRSVYLGLREVFKETLVIPGDTAYFIASDDPGYLTYDYKVLMSRAKERGLSLEYVREYYLFSRLSPGIVDYTLRVLRDGRLRLNRDFSPSAYYYNMVFWASRSGGRSFKGLLEKAGSGWLLTGVLILCGLIVFYGVYARRGTGNSRRRYGAIALAVSGFSAMAAQVIMLFSFQVIYGYVFYKIGILLTVFMAGLAAGSFRMAYRAGEIRRSREILTALVFLTCLLSLALPGVFSVLASSGSGFVSRMGSGVLFPLLSSAAGFLAGAQFPLAARVCSYSPGVKENTAGLAYGAELAGSCIGAFLTGMFLIPVFGVGGSCFAIAVLNLSVLMMLSLDKG